MEYKKSSSQIFPTNLIGKVTEERMKPKKHYTQRIIRGGDRFEYIMWENMLIKSNLKYINQNQV